MRTPTRIATATTGLIVASAAGACSSFSTNGSSSSSEPKNVQVIVDTGPGGGSDLFGRQLVKVARTNKLISTNWPVVGRPEGGGLGAMAFLREKQGNSSFISAFTSKWIIAGLGNPKAPAKLSDLTPIAEVADETQVIAARADAPYDTMSGFIAAAKSSPGKLVQTGGSVNSIDNLVALQMQHNTGTNWKYLSFDDGGPRITALLRGDAQIDIGAESDFAEQIAAKKLKLIGVISNHRLADYPNVQTLQEQKVNLGQLPEQLQFRGIAGPPGMPAATVKYYQGMLSKLVKSPAWNTYLKSQGLTSHFTTGPQLKTLLANFTNAVKPLVASLPKGGE